MSLEKKDLKNHRAIKKIIYLMGTVFALIQILNSLFFNTTPFHLIRFPISEFYGNQGLSISIIIFLLILYLTNYKGKKDLIDIIIIWSYCFINSIYLRFHDAKLYTTNFLLVLFSIILLSIILFYMDLFDDIK